MSNKFRWFTHDHDAHEDAWVRQLVRKQGHVAGWLWWVLVELMHKHGVGDVLKRDLSDVARAGLTSTSVVTRVLTEMGTEFEGQSKVSWTLVGTELRLEIKKFRERQSKLKSNLPPTLHQPSVNLPIQYSTVQDKTRQENKQITDRPLRAFTAPTVEQVKAYCQERSNNVDPQVFVDHYETRGWKPKGYNTQMKDWKAAVRTWEKNNYGNGSKAGNGSPVRTQAIAGKYAGLEEKA